MYCQAYYNKVFSYDGNILNPIELTVTGDRIIVTSLNLVNDISASSFYVIDRTTFDTSVLLVDYSQTRKSPHFVNGKLYAFGDDRSGNNEVSFLKFDEELDMIIANNFTTPLGYSGSACSTFLKDHLFGASIDEYSSGTHREITLKKIDTLGNESWSRNFGQDSKLNFAWELLPSNDDELFMSSRIVYNNIFGGFPQLYKLDAESGETIWKKEIDERIINGSTPVHIAQLSNNNIVQSYMIRNLDDPNIVKYNYNVNVTKMNWLDSDGDSLYAKNLYIPSRHNLFLSEIIAGKGPYFFAYGSYEDKDADEDLVRGVIIKLNNQGDTIWHHRYHHPDFLTPDYFHNIVDITELDNGDIVAMGKISKPAEKNKIWLFKINEHGCFHDLDDCSEIVTSSSEIQQNDYPILFYPNPSDGIFHLRRDIDIEQISISNIQGENIFTTRNLSQDFIDLSRFPTGIYFAKIVDASGKSHTMKLMKL